MSSLFHMHLRLAMRRELRRQGKTSAQINALMAGCDEDVVDEAISQAKATAEVAALGDGTILQAILDFLNSPLGKAIIAAIIALLGGL